MPNKLLGQNFLKNVGVIEKIVKAIDVVPGDTIFEIGPGHGELTLPLARRCVEVGARLIAIEKDQQLIEGLKKSPDLSGLEFVLGDALEILSAQTRGMASFKIVGNIPYYLTGHLLRIIGELEALPERCVFMVQREVADRVVAQPPDMSRLAASIQFWAEPTIIIRVPRKDFVPQPKVDSAVILLKTKKENFSISSERYYAALRALFAQPRKTTLNNLASALGNLSKEDIVGRLGVLQINPAGRPQDISVYALAQIANSFF